MANQMNKEEYETKIGELELMIEEMERTDSLLYGITFGLSSQFIWHEWLVSVVVGISITIIYWKFLAKRPFTRKIIWPDSE